MNGDEAWLSHNFNPIVSNSFICHYSVAVHVDIFGDSNDTSLPLMTLLFNLSLILTTSVSTYLPSTTTHIIRQAVIQILHL